MEENESDRFKYTKFEYFAPKLDSSLSDQSVEQCLNRLGSNHKFYRCSFHMNVINEGIYLSFSSPVPDWEGGYLEPPLSFSLNIFQTNRDIGTKLSVPSGTSILYTS